MVIDEMISPVFESLKNFKSLFNKVGEFKDDYKHVLQSPEISSLLREAGAKTIILQLDKFFF